MGRVVKDPEVRKKELIVIAEKIFIEKGFDETSVSDIVKEADVAQGTFYYYFKSKDEILNAIVDEVMTGIVDLFQSVLDDGKINAIEKIKKIFYVSLQHRRSHEGQERIADVVHDEKHELLHVRLQKANTPIFEDMFEKLISQGCNEGLFDTEFPEEAAMALVAIMTAMGHRKKNGSELTDEDKIKLFYAYLDLLERILGTKKGAFAEVTKIVEESK